MGISPFGPPPSPLEPEAASEVPDELARVVGWRIEMLVKGGCDVVLAGQLAGIVDFDLHKALDLLHDGCAPHLIYRILS